MTSQACYPEKAPKVNKMLDILYHHLRREIIHYFETHTDDETAAIDDVIIYLDKRVPEESTETLHTELRHHHLPKLAESGWINYDTRTGHIQYLGHDQATQWLDEIRVMF